jgi:SAM-dependent methyltransferase
LLYELLVHGLGARSSEIEFERPLPEVHGRADALLGQTVFEFKRDLRRERRDAEQELGRYLPRRELETGERFIGVATDGADFIAYEIRDDALTAMSTYATDLTSPRSLLVWLDAAVSVKPNLSPEPSIICFELGRQSLAYKRALGGLSVLWQAVCALPEVRLKRQLWADLLMRAYGSRVDADELFLQHTYLTIVAKTMAVCVLSVPLPEPSDLLSGRPFRQAGIAGAVESDFFDWVLHAPGGAELVGRISRQTARFRLEDVEHDVLKSLYESLVDPEQRHDLGEYYTPDWLAARICEAAIDRPLQQRVLDPACGSGTFLFHVTRRIIRVAEEQGLAPAEVFRLCLERVAGIDVHPVAVLVARVTFLLALGHERLQNRRQGFSIPIYLGDALQWNTRTLFAASEVVISVPDGPELLFPERIVNDPARFDDIVQTMLELSEYSASKESIRAWLRDQGLASDSDIDILVQTYVNLRTLKRSGRDHIWGYVTRNLTRPLWLSSIHQRADVVVGNPPWLSYRYMTPDFQRIFREECRLRNLWSGGKLAAHHDLSAYFFARCAELYVRNQGVIAFVMPYAVLSRAQFAGIRAGRFNSAEVRLIGAWAFDETVQPLMPLPSAVLFARRTDAGPLPARLTAWRGVLPRRDASAAEAERALSATEVAWPTEVLLTGGSPYRRAFRQGATMVPRRLCLVDRVDLGRLGSNPVAPMVASRTGTQDKEPWRSLPALKGAVEARFLRPLLLGESIAPFRVLKPALSVVPWDPAINAILDGDAAERRGYPGLSRWMRQAEHLWAMHRRAPMPLINRWNYLDALASQLPPAAIRVVYAKSGILFAAAIIEDRSALVDHKLYWAEMSSQAEACYLAAILNSETARARIAPQQSRGRWGARDFDKVMFELPIPRFEPQTPLHGELAQAARHAIQVAARVALPDELHFVRARRAIRGALEDDGVRARIETLVAALLA